MSILLQSTVKSQRGVDTGKSVSLDLGKLGVGFGGFSPMALSDRTASREQVLEAEGRILAYRESLERAAALEAARASDLRTWQDEAGTVWRYVVLDEADVRIEGCETTAAVLNIPEAIEGKPVVALASDACAFLPSVEEITCPNSVISLGFCVFRGNRALRSVVFPAQLADFSSEWIRGCSALEHMVLPGRLAGLNSSIFDVPALHSLVVGAGTCEVAPGTFAKSKLTSLQVDPDNPFLSTDGAALYSKDGSALVALAVPQAEYRIREGCAAVAKKGFSMFSCVQRIEAPESLEVLGEFAFSRTAITSFSAPASLRHIGEKAFFNCASLESVQFQEGLVSVAANAFTGTNLRELRLPASIEELGNPVAARTGLTYVGSDATFSIAEGPEHLTLDEAGGLYRMVGGEKHLVRLMDPDACIFAVQPGTAVIDAGACAGHVHLTEAVLPEGLREIGKGAFKGCSALVRAALPESVQRLGDEAFLDTNLECVCIPAGLTDVGRNALVSHGSHHGTELPSLRSVSVAEGNERFYTAPGLLLERKGTGASRVLLYTGDVDVVRIPSEVDEIAPYAFNDVEDIRELHLSDRITTVGIRGLGIGGFVELIHIDLAQAIEGHESFDLRFPNTDRGAQQMMLALSVPDHVNVEALFEHYDNAIINGSSFDPESDRGLGLYDQATRMVARLLDPVFLTPVNRSMCERFLGNNIAEICVAVAKHDDRKTIDALLDLGFLNADNLFPIIDRIGAVQDAAMTGYLLEVRRVRFGRDALDFDL